MRCEPVTDVRLPEFIDITISSHVRDHPETASRCIPVSAARCSHLHCTGSPFIGYTPPVCRMGKMGPCHFFSLESDLNHTENSQIAQIRGWQTGGYMCWIAENGGLVEAGFVQQTKQGTLTRIPACSLYVLLRVSANLFWDDSVDCAGCLHASNAHLLNECSLVFIAFRMCCVQRIHGSSNCANVLNCILHHHQYYYY